MKPGKRITVPKLSEADIERACCDYLVLDGWRVFKTEFNFSEKKRKAVGELGMPDRQCIRYKQDCWARRAEVLWVEFKSRTGKLAQHQRDWAERERCRGALVWLAGEDFAAGSVEAFVELYRASGLARRVR